jgi:hypothetical protein
MGLEIKEGKDLLDDFIRRLDSGAVQKATVGIHGDVDSEVATYAIQNEFGGKIITGGTAYGFESKAAAKRGEVRFLSKKKLMKGKGFISGFTGPSEVTIPARPFMRQTFDKYKEEIYEIGLKFARLVRDGSIDVKEALFGWGEYYNNLIQSEINEGTNFAENAKSTLKKKGGNKNPLQDKGRLQQSIKTVVD